MGDDIVDMLEDLIKQAKVDRSHYYVAGVAQKARDEIIILRKDLAKLNTTINRAIEHLEYGCPVIKE